VITVVLDDDPTGTQAMSDVSVVLDWRDASAWATVQPGDRGVHVLTNSRAYTGRDAAALVASAAAASKRHHPQSRILLRGDSTLRAHVWEEYEALRRVVAPERSAVPLLLVPALPAAGRVTLGSIHMLELGSQRVRLDETEYARDGALTYASSHLPLWAEERSGGRFLAADAVCLSLERIRRPDGPRAVAEALAEASRLRRPAVVVPDAEVDGDLRVVAAGVELAESAGTLFLVRSAPAFVAALTGQSAASLAEVPAGDRGVLVLCGSFVSTSTKQIERLVSAYPDSLVSASVTALGGAGSEQEVERVVALARTRIELGGLAVVSTDRVRNPAFVDPVAQRRIADALARVASHVHAGVVIAKGGITSAVTVREGLGARAARVVGPVRSGVARWRLPDGREYLVVPGNVGDSHLLCELVRSIVPIPQVNLTAPKRAC